MAFTVEDGSGVPGANSYTSEAFALEYHQDRGNSAWGAADQVAQTAALIKATQFLESFDFLGYRYSDAQGLSWPREDVYDPDGYEVTGIPVKLQQAVCEAALVALSADLDPALDRGGKVKKDKTGPLETEYMDNAPVKTIYPKVIALIRNLIRSRAGKVRILR